MSRQLRVLRRRIRLRHCVLATKNWNLWHLLVVPTGGPWRQLHIGGGTNPPPAPQARAGDSAATWVPTKVVSATAITKQCGRMTNLPEHAASSWLAGRVLSHANKTLALAVDQRRRLRLPTSGGRLRLMAIASIVTVCPLQHLLQFCPACLGFLQCRAFIYKPPRGVVVAEGFDEKPPGPAFDDAVPDIAHVNGAIFSCEPAAKGRE